MSIGKIVIAGGSGFLGRTLEKWYVSLGREVVVLSRGEHRGKVNWDGRTLDAWVSELEGA